MFKHVPVHKVCLSTHKNLIACFRTFYFVWGEWCKIYICWNSSHCGIQWDKKSEPILSIFGERSKTADITANKLDQIESLILHHELSETSREWDSHKERHCDRARSGSEASQQRSHLGDEPTTSTPAHCGNHE